MMKKVIPSSKLQQLTETIKEKNARLSKAGGPTFSLQVSEPFWKEVFFEDGRIITTKAVEVMIDKEIIKIGDWELVGALQKEDGGFIYHNFTIDYMAENMNCDHCGVKRNRNLVFVLKDEENLMQVGSTCVKPFLGENAPSLWAISFEEEDLEEELGEFESFQKEAPYHPVKDVLSLAIFHSDSGRKFIGADRGTKNHLCTADRVRKDLLGFPSLDNSEEVAKLLQKIEEHPSQEPSSWIEKIKTICQGDYVSNSNLSLLVSAVVLLNSSDNQDWATGHVGVVGEKLEPQELLLVSVKTRVASGFSYYQPEVLKDILTLKDSSGKMITFFASRELGLKPGKIRLLSGRVKSHGSYQGIDQTVIFRARFEAA